MLIDIHTHVFPDKLAKGAVGSLAAKAGFTPFTDGTLSDTKRLMREQGVDAFVALNIAVSPKTERHVNDFALSLRVQEGVIPFGSVHPDSSNALEELKRLKDAGIKGIKIHNEYQNFYADDEKAFPIYEFCERNGLIVLFHGGADRGYLPPVKASPARLRNVCFRFPEAKIVAAHLGGQDMAREAIDCLVSTGAYIDTSFSSRSVDPAVAEEVMRAFGADRILFGTDCPWDTPENTVAYIEKMPFTAEEKAKIYYKNACKLLNLCPEEQVR